MDPSVYLRSSNVSTSRFINILSNSGDLRLEQRETDLRFQMTPEVLDKIGRQLVDAARRMECGVRFTGAGGGGCMWALGTPDQLNPLRTEWQSILAQHTAAGILETAIDVDGVL